MAEAVQRINAGWPYWRNCRDVVTVMRALAAQKDYSKTGVELGPITFEADVDALLRKPNAKYIDAEIAWYMSGDRSVHGLVAQYGKLPIVWKEVAGPDGRVASQYGIRVFGRRSDGTSRRAPETFPSQYDRVLSELTANPDSRRAIFMYAGRGTMFERGEYGGDDQLCTISVQLLRSKDDGLIYHVHMRSNDAVYGYANDAAWHHYLITRHLLWDLPLCFRMEPPRIIWTAGALTVYPRHVHLLHDDPEADGPAWPYGENFGKPWDWTMQWDEHDGYKGA